MTVIRSFIGDHRVDYDCMMIFLWMPEMDVKKKIPVLLFLIICIKSVSGNITTFITLYLFVIV